MTGAFMLAEIAGGLVSGSLALLADAGHKVVLVEREPSIGGHMAAFDKTFPTLDCAACILTPKMVAADRRDNIHLLTESEVESVDGFVGNFTVQVREKAHTRSVGKWKKFAQQLEPLRARLESGDVEL